MVGNLYRAPECGCMCDSSWARVQAQLYGQDICGNRMSLGKLLHELCVTNSAHREVSKVMKSLQG